MHWVEKRHWYFLGAGILTLLCLSVSASAHTTAEPFQKGTTVHLLTQQLAFTPAETFTVDIAFTTDGTALNAMEAEVFFDPAIVHVTGVSFTDELCEERFIVTAQIDNEIGRVHLVCGTVTPFIKTKGTFATLTLEGITPGQSTLTFGQHTHVLAHDGYGTETLSVRTDAKVTITEV